MKKRQHYVWQSYLKPWVEDGHIWCNINGELKRYGLKKIGQKPYFYKIKELSSIDIKYLKWFIAQSKDASLIKINEGWINMFSKPFQLREYFKENPIKGVDIEQEVRKELDKLEVNLEENFHSKIECASKKYLDSILASDTSFFNNAKDCYAFLHYLCLQYTRTNNMQKRFLKMFTQVDGANLESIWSVLRHVIAMNIARPTCMEREKYRLIILRNNSGIKFITSDQPVINTYAVDGTGSEGFEFYYPVSPSLAVLLTEKDEFKTKELVDIDDAQVRGFNQFIANLSDEQIYAHSQDNLIMFKKEVKVD